MKFLRTGNEDVSLPKEYTAVNNNIQFAISFENSLTDGNWLMFDLATEGDNDMTISIHYYRENGGVQTETEKSSVVQMSQKVIPNCRAELPFPVSRAAFRLEKHFLVPYSALRKGGMGGIPVEKEEIAYAVVTIASHTLTKAVLYGMRVCEERPDSVLSGEPVVDCFGQYVQGEWTNKIHSEEELKAFLTAEYEKTKKGASYPDGWSKWGGWTAKKFDATGYFHTAHDGRRWWLVDPDGYAFFSNGICYGERAGIFGLTDQYTPLHEWLPDENGKYADAWCTAANIPQYIVRNGREGADRRKMFNFARANLIRVFGDRWHEAYTAITSYRLHEMGFNTVGVGTNDYYNERTAEFLRDAKIPYVVTFRDFPLTKKCIFRDFPDVFSEEYRTLCREFAERSLTQYVGDPYMIGYFVTNEPEWFFGANNSLTERLMASDGCTESKEQLILYLREKYTTVEALNAAWETSFSAWESLLSEYHFTDGRNDSVIADFDTFEKKLVAAYGRVLGDELRKVDSHHLNLGLRFGGFRPKVLSFDSDFVDVFSMNCYGASAADRAESISEKWDIPIISGEWHIGCFDGGLPAPGLCYLPSQAERAEGCRYYMESSVRQKNIVGVHYFEYNDQPYFGRFDGECYQIGLSDVCHRQYRAVCDMFADFAKKMYPILTGEATMTATYRELLHY